MRGATRFAFCHATHLTYFNPRSTCEERQGDEYIADGTLEELAEKTGKKLASLEWMLTPSAKKRASAGSSVLVCIGEEIYVKKFQSTLLMRGATSTRHPTRGSSRYFNPRSSCEERRLHLSCPCRYVRYFNPRSSCEERPGGAQSRPIISYFNPRSSCEERLAKSFHLTARYTISIHAPHARSDKSRM